ncbi:MAG: PorT family protein [Prevotella sp.]|nr:PorT family protein [Prevotella sp.]
MKKLLVVAAILFGAVTANAQNEVGQISIAPTIGLNYAKITMDKQKFAPFFEVGANAEYGLMEKLGLSAGVFYSLQGSKDDGHGDIKTKTAYINVPILANYYVWNGLAVKAGIQPGYLISAKRDGTDVKDYAKKFDLGIPVGVSYEISNVVVDLRYVFGVTNVTKKPYDEGKNQVIQLTAGYKFKL